MSSLLYLCFQNQSQLLRSGWDLYRQENKAGVEADGFVGKQIASKLGEQWRDLTKAEKNIYSRKAYVLKNMKLTTMKLCKTKACSKSKSSAVSLKRQKSA